MKAEKPQHKAKLRTLANKNELNFCTKRLIKDLDEVENNRIPTVGVAAAPLEDDLFVWHANIKGPDGTPYQGGVFHIEIRIPQNYPIGPPTITLLSPNIPHPNITNSSICLDMLTESTEPGQGWSSGYTILSILIQLQSFFFEEFYDSTNRKHSIKKAVDDSNQFKCKNKGCKHGGKLAAWPAFSTEEATKDSFKIFESERDLFERELICYHTKIDHRENALGLGLSISRIPRTGLIKQASPCLDYVSLKAFIKEGVRKSSNNEDFSHWLPLYFGEDKSRTLHLGKRSISMICTSHTRRFKEEMILDVFPKILITIIIQIVKAKRHCSIRIIRLLAHCLCFYILLLEQFPHLKTELQSQINLFIKDEAKRVKDVIPNLGAFVTNLLVDFGANQKEVLEASVQEQLDRQVFWMFQNIPEVEDSADDTYLDRNRANIAFNHDTTSFHMMMCFKVLSDIIRNNFKSTEDLLQYFEKNQGKFSNDMEDRIQKSVFEIAKVDSFERYFDFLGLPKLDPETLNKLLKQSIENSLKKKYHGTDDELFALPSTDDQIANLKKNQPKFEDFFDEAKGELRQATEQEWKEACINRWRWLKDICENFDDAKPNLIAVKSDRRLKNLNSKKEDELAALKQSYLQNSNEANIQQASIQRYSEGLTWQELFLKLDLEEHLMTMNYNPDFHNFYNKLKANNKFIKALMIPVGDVKNLKSGYHYLTAVLSQLTNLESIEFLTLDGEDRSMTMPALKSIAKGLNNLKKNEVKLKEVWYDTFNLAAREGYSRNEILEKAFFALTSIPNLQSITINSNNMLSLNGGKVMAKVVISQTNLLELNLRNCYLSQETAKDLADGLMRAKQLQKMDISGNDKISGAGAASIVYNLAFLPRLASLNISKNPFKAEDSTLVEALYKLLRISASLEVLDMSNLTTFNKGLTREFFASLGEAHALRILDISASGPLSSLCYNMLGKAIAFNAQKKGHLEVVYLQSGVVGSIRDLNAIHGGMLISKYDHESWYGDSSKLEKLEGKDLEKVYYNNLRSLQLSSNVVRTDFKYKAWKKQYKPKDIEFVKLIAQTKKLENVQLSSCTLDKQDADALCLALNPSRPNYASNVRILNVSKNQLGKDGIKTLAAIFEKNKTLQVLDVSGNDCGVAGAQILAQHIAKNDSLKYFNIFGNNIDVDGARAFEKALTTNTSLEFVDFGHNRLRDEGVASLARGLVANTKSGVKYLGLRFNFISEDGVVAFLKKLYPEGKYSGKLQSLFINNNRLNEFALYNILKVYTSLNVKLHVDIFDKLKLLEASALERTVWIHPASAATAKEFKHFFETQKECGIVLGVRRATGPKWSNRKRTANDFYFVEFADPTSVRRALQIASKKEATINENGFRVFKAGSGSYIFTKKRRANPGINAARAVEKRRKLRALAAAKMRARARANQERRGGRGNRRGG